MRWRCFNDCFSRKIKAGMRPIDPSPQALIAPCDGLLSVWRITDGLVLPVKESRYRISDLLSDDREAERFRNGFCFVFRLCVNDYHRYCYFDDAVKGENVFLPGVLHTVRPIALESVPVFVRNCREYTLLDTAHFGHAAQIEVGAMLVGKIENYHGACTVSRGEEKGRFLYGGSTVILLLPEDAVLPDPQYIRTENGNREIPVRMGRKIGSARFPS